MEPFNSAAFFLLQNAKWYHQACAPSYVPPMNVPTVPMGCPPGNQQPMFSPRETSHETTLPGSAGDHPCGNKVEIKRTISRLIRSFKKNLEEIVEAKEACTAAGERMEMSRSELADFVRKEIRKALSCTKTNFNAGHKVNKYF